MIDKDTMTKEFCELVRTASLSGQERQFARVLQQKLEALGLSVHYDDAGEAIDGDTGNLWCHIEGNSPHLPTLMLNAHMDTVKPGIGIEPVRDGDMITSAGDTILGADDKAGITIILAVIRELLEDDAPHGDIQVLFTIAEETGLNGAKHLDYGVMDADCGLILDGGRMAGQVVTAAPSAMSMTYTVAGKAAHAGVCPEEGINAIQACAAGVAAMDIGRIDDETTANIGLIEGGEATNIVAPRCIARGEARSHDEDKLAAQVEHMRQTMQEACEEAGAAVEIEESRSYSAFSLADDHPLVQAALKAAENLGIDGETLRGGGGSDANVFNAHGIASIILATGTRDPHTLEESLNVAVMENCARWLRQTIDVLWENA